MAQPATVTTFFTATENVKALIVTDGGGITSDNSLFTTDGAGNVTAVSLVTSGAIAVNQLQGGQSATTPALANSGTIATASVREARVTPAAAVSGIILAAGTQPAQEVTVVNNGALGSNVVFATDATSNVTNGLTTVIQGLSSMRFIWDSVGLRWNAQLPSGLESATAVVIINGNTIATAGLKVSRVAPGGAVTGIILAAGTYPTQEITVVNESTAANSVTFAAVGTSFVADGVSSVIAGLNARRFQWDSATSTWFPCK